MFKLDEDSLNFRACIKVIGVGGGGGNAIKTMRESGLSGVQFMVANTDVQALEEHEGLDAVIQMGAQLTGGLGAGANPEIGRQAAIESCEQIGSALKGANMVFITAGMGGGTGTGSAGVIARIAKEQGALTVGVVTRPFFFEGQRRSRHAEMGIQFLKENVDTLIVIPNQKLLQAEEEQCSLLSAFKNVDHILLTAVQGIVDLINQKGLINLDFADVKTIMSERGLAIIGTGTAKGPERSLLAGRMAISSPLLEEDSFKGASGLIINITGGADLSLKEVNQTAELISREAHPEAEIIFGAIVNPDKSMEELKVTVIATGFEGRQHSTHVADPEKSPVKEKTSEQPYWPKQPKNVQENKPTSPLSPPVDDEKKYSAPSTKQNPGQEAPDKPLETAKEPLPPSLNRTKKLPRDILMEKAKAYQEEIHKKHIIDKNDQQLSMDIPPSSPSKEATVHTAPFKKQRHGLINFFRKSDKTLQ